MSSSIEFQSINSAARLLENVGAIFGGKDADGAEFSDIFSDAYNLAKSTDLQDKTSALSLLTGEEDDIVSVMADSKKAELALSLTIEIRNKVMDAYKEIMNMQV